MKEVSKNLPKIDGMGLVLGRPAFTDDLASKDALIVKVLRSPHAFARIKNIDSKKALDIEGVECVLTYKDVSRNIFTRAGQGYPEPSPYDKFILDEYVRHVGDEVAVVAAIDEKSAIEALGAIEVEYEVLEPILDFEKAYENKMVIHPESEVFSMFPIGLDKDKNVAASYNMNVGDVDKELSKCDVVVKERFFTQSQAHVMMEPHSSYIYLDFHGRLNVISSTQTPFHLRRIMSKALDIPRRDIRVVKPRIGGGYGGKQQLHGELLTSLVTLKTKKPAKLIYTRKEVFESTCTRHQMAIDVTLGASKDGQLKAIDMNILSDTGAYGEHALTVFMVAGSKTLPMYNKVDAVRFGGRVVYTNKTPAGAFRGYGAIQANFALESLVDKLCEKLSIDHIEFRERNMIKENETSEIFKIMGEGTEGTAMNIESCKLDYCIKRGKELIGWDKKGIKREISKGKVRGLGMAIAMQGSGIPYIDMASATLKLNDDGFFNLTLGATDLGTGSDTVMAQIAAETLGVSTQDIKVYSSDTDLTPFDTGAYASSTTYISGHAVRLAAEDMRELIIKTAAQNFKVEEDSVTFNGEYIDYGKDKITLKEFSTNLYYTDQQKQLVSSNSYVGHKSPPPYMAGFAEVEIDLETGKYKVLDYVAVVDCGTTINPNLAKIQVEGALVQGIGMTMYEEVKMSEKGNLLTNNMMNYKIPTRLDFDKLTVEFAQSYEPSGPYGAKSVGEIGIDTPPAAIANAVFNATGVRITTLPITPEKLFMELKK